MARRPRLFAPEILYHVIVRGNHREKTFLTDGDYRAYLERLARYRTQFGVTVYAYCLMSNHVHLLLESGSEPLSKFMQGLQQSYTQYFNRKHHKIGHLFQGRYKAIVCDKDEYLLSLVRYIHLNPVRAKIVDKLDEYPYSGHRYYLNGRGSDVLEPSRVLEILGGRRSYRDFINDGLKDGHREEYYRLTDQRFLGAEEFAEKIREKGNEKPIPKPKRKLTDVFRTAARAVELAPAVLAGADRGWQISRLRALVAHVLTRSLGYKLSDVARCLNRDIATVSSLASRFSQRLAENDGLRQQAARITADCLKAQV